MNIAKIFHVYFGFIMLISTFALASYHHDAWKYFESGYVSVLNVTELPASENHGTVSIELSGFSGEWKQDLAKSFVYAGGKYDEGLMLAMKGNGVLEAVKVAVGGDDVVESADLVFGEKRFEGKSDGNGFVFNNLKTDLGDGVEGKLILGIDEDATSGDRFSLVIGKEAFKIRLGFQSYFFPENEGEKKVYFSVVGKK